MRTAHWQADKLMTALSTQLVYCTAQHFWNINITRNLAVANRSCISCAYKVTTVLFSRGKFFSFSPGVQDTGGSGHCCKHKFHRGGGSRGRNQKFKCHAVVEGNKPSCVILYDDDKQIADVKRFCASPNSRGVLGIDRTFNLRKCFVTVTTFKYTDVTRHRTNEAPVFLGPCYLHWDVKSPYTLEMCVLAFSMFHWYEAFVWCYTNFWCDERVLCRLFWCLFSFSMLLLTYIKNVRRREPWFWFPSVAFGGLRLIPTPFHRSV